MRHIWYRASNRRAIAYMAANLGSKGLAAVAQLYAIFVFTKMHTQDQSALIFLLLGYAIWFQAFELGLAQTLQNKFNERQISVDEMLVIALGHYFFMLMIAAVILTTPFLSNLLLPSSRIGMEGRKSRHFLWGARYSLLRAAMRLARGYCLYLTRGSGATR